MMRVIQHNAVKRHIGIAKVAWIHAGSTPIPPSQNATQKHEPRRTWQLMRMDDHGVEVEMAVFADKAVALAECATFEERGHHQTYFVRESNALPTATKLT